MPSRKRIQGKARAAQRAQKKCEHGCLLPPPPPDHMIYTFFDLFKESLREANSEGLLFAGHYAIQTSIDEYPEAIEDDTSRSIFEHLIISSRTNLLLAGQLTSKRIAKWYAQALIQLHDYEKQNEILYKAQFKDDEESYARTKERASTRKSLARLRDLDDGGDRAVIEFFAKRIPCSCLDAILEEATTTQPRRGYCFHCHELKDRSQLKLCGRCKLNQYCSTKCQQADWKVHKEKCTELCKG